MSSSFLLYLLFGKLLIYFGMKFPPLSESRFDFVKRLFSCDECLGGWVYIGMSFLMGEVLFRDVIYVPALSQVITGLLSAFFMHLVSLGWKSKFEVVVIE